MEISGRSPLSLRDRSKGRLLWWIALAVAGLVMLATASQPEIGLGVVGATVLGALALRSPALPLALSGSALAALVLGGRLPKGGTVGLYAAWILFGVAVALVRGGDLPRLQRVVNVGTVSVVALVGLLLVRLPASGDYAYGWNKLQLMLVLAVVPMLAGIVVGYRAVDRRLLLVATALVGVATACYGAVLISTGAASGANYDRLSLDDSIDPIGLGRAMGTVILVLVFYFVRARRARMRLLAMAAVLPAAVVLIGSGSRGPLLGLVVGLPVLVIGLAGQPASLRRAIVAIGATAVGGAIAIVTVVPPAVAGRVLSIFGSTEQQGELSRYALWSDAITIWSRDAATALVGVGTGGYAALTQYRGTLYPHNLLIETGVELGVVGVLVLLIGLAWTFSRAYALTRVPGEAGAFGAYLLAVLAMDVVTAQFSGDMPYNADIWVTTGLIVGLAADVARRRASPLPAAADTSAAVAAGPGVVRRRLLVLRPPTRVRVLPPAPAVPSVGKPRERYAATMLLYALAAAFAVSLAAGIALDAAESSLSLPTGDGAPLAAPWRGWTLALFGVLAIVATALTGRRRIAIERARPLATVGFGGVAVTGIGILAGSAGVAAAGVAAALLAGTLAGTLSGGMGLRGLYRKVRRRL